MADYDEVRKAKNREYRQRWLEKNRDKFNAYKREWNKRTQSWRKYAEQSRKWAEENKAGISRKRFARLILKLYGITIEQYDQMFLEQHGQCGLCQRRQEEFRRRFGVDHDHTTGQVRRLLCAACNTALGGFQDDPELMRKGADYVESFRGMQ